MDTGAARMASCLILGCLSRSSASNVGMVPQHPRDDVTVDRLHETETNSQFDHWIQFVGAALRPASRLQNFNRSLVDQLFNSSEELLARFLSVILCDRVVSQCLPVLSTAARRGVNIGR